MTEPIPRTDSTRAQASALFVDNRLLTVGNPVGRDAALFARLGIGPMTMPAPAPVVAAAA